MKEKLKRNHFQSVDFSSEISFCSNETFSCSAVEPANQEKNTGHILESTGSAAAFINQTSET
jgi:hypothetical protein